MANTNPFPIYRPGDGVRYPVRQAPIHTYDGNLDPRVSAKLYKSRKPNPYSSAIIANPATGRVVASAFSQFGRGKTRAKPVPWRDLAIHFNTKKRY